MNTALMRNSAGEGGSVSRRRSDQQRRRCVAIGLSVCLFLAGASLLIAQKSRAGSLSAGASGSVPELFGFALDGKVREAKTECYDELCSSYVLVRKKTEAGAGTLGRIGEEPPRDLELWRLDVPAAGSRASTPSMRRLRSSVPSTAGRLALCERVNSNSLVMLQALGSVYFVDPSSDDQELDGGTRVGSQKWSAPAAPWNAVCSELMLVGPGAVRKVTLAGRGTMRSVLSATEFPIDFSIRLNGSGLTLESPPVRRVSKDSTVVAVGPQTYDDLRVESLVFEPSADSAQWLEALAEGSDESIDAADGEMMRCWSRLPAAEEVLQSRYVTVAGRLVLVIVTKEADKVGLLERKKLRLFELEADRTRSGKLPFFELLTASRLWQRLDIQFLDVTGDQIEDLVLIQPEGLSGEPTLADVFVATSPLRFSPKKARTVLETGAVWWSLENDWNGDGVIDVAVLDGEVLQFHHGVSPAEAGSKRRKRGGYWSAAPSRVMRLGESQLVRGSGAEEMSGIETVWEGMGTSVLQQVWVDHGVMVVPTDFERPTEASAADGNELVTIDYDDDEADESTGEDDQSSSGGFTGLVVIVRAGAGPSEGE